MDVTCYICQAVSYSSCQPLVTAVSQLQLRAMFRVFSAASGGAHAVLDAAEFDAMVAECGDTVGALKRYLVEKHLERKCSRFQMRILRDGDLVELPEDEIIAPPMDVQLMLLNHLPPDSERDRLFLQNCSTGQVDRVESSLKALQDPNLPCRSTDSDGPGPLCAAADAGQIDVARLLLDAGADMEAKDLWGWRPLHLAARKGHSDVVRLLLDSGAEKEAVSSSGRTAHEEAIALKRDAVAKVFRQYDRRKEPARCVLAAVCEMFGAKSRTLQQTKHAGQVKRLQFRGMLVLGWVIDDRQGFCGIEGISDSDLLDPSARTTWVFAWFCTPLRRLVRLPVYGSVAGIKGVNSKPLEKVPTRKLVERPPRPRMVTPANEESPLARRSLSKLCNLTSCLLSQLSQGLGSARDLGSEHLQRGISVFA